MQTSGWRQALGNHSSEVEWVIGLGPIQLPTAAFLGSHLDMLEGPARRRGQSPHRSIRDNFDSLASIGMADTRMSCAVVRFEGSVQEGQIVK
jgi:hypothetical protein